MENKQADRKFVFSAIAVILCTLALGKILSTVFGVHDEEEEYVLFMFSASVVIAVIAFVFQPPSETKEMNNTMGVGFSLGAVITGAMFLFMHFL